MANVWNESEERRQVKVTLLRWKATLSERDIQDETALGLVRRHLPVKLGQSYPSLRTVLANTF